MYWLWSQCVIKGALTCKQIQKEGQSACSQSQSTPLKVLSNPCKVFGGRSWCYSSLSGRLSRGGVQGQLYDSEFRSNIQALSGCEWQVLDNPGSPLQFDIDKPVKRIILIHSQAAAEEELATLLHLVLTATVGSAAQVSEKNGFRP